MRNIFYLMRIIGIATRFNLKFIELERHFKLYGIECTQLQERSPSFFRKFLQETDVIAVIQEQSALLDKESRILIEKEPVDGTKVIHTSNLTAWILKDGSFISSTYTWETMGTIDYSKRNPKPEPDCYDWDDIFVVDGSVYTIYEIHKHNGVKVSSRDFTVSNFIKEFIYYKKRLVLFYDNPLNESALAKRTIDFDEKKDPINILGILFCQGVPVSSEAPTTWTDIFLENIKRATLNNGIIYRASKNRREKLYWLPGLNSGIPFVKKPDDPVHEYIFAFHDCVHYMIPDLIFDGVHTSPLHKKVYVGTRLISEVLALVTGDMIKVHSLGEEGIPYKTSHKRKIYPVYKHFDPQTHDQVLALYRWLFRCGFYNEFDPAVPAFQDFFDKYEIYFIDDYRWTLHNWNDMVSHKEAFADWWETIEPLRKMESWPTYCTTAEFINTYDLKEDDTAVLPKLFEIMLQKYIIPKMDGVLRPIADPVTRRMYAFRRYMTGQLNIFSTFSIVPESAIYKTRIVDLLKADIIEINVVRNLYQEYLDILLDKRFIDPDDHLTYNEIYPLFKPMIIDYTTKCIDVVRKEFNDFTSERI